MTPRKLTTAALTRAEAHASLKWRYPEQFAVYDLDDGDLKLMLDPANRYQGIHLDGEYIGYVCFGAEARVPGMVATPGVEDFGMGLAPELVGQGLSRWLLPELFAALRARRVLSGHTLRAVILDWNLRSQTAARAAGFTQAGELESREGRFLVMTLALN